MTKFYAPLFALALGACTVGEGQVDVSETRGATFPGVPAARLLAGEAVTTDADVTLDLTKDLASLSDLGSLRVDISKNAISGTALSVIRHVKATIATKDGKIPEAVASDVEVPANSTEIELPLLITDAQVLAFLTEGPVTLHLYLTGDIPQQSFTLQYALAAHVSIEVNESISKL